MQTDLSLSCWLRILQVHVDGYVTFDGPLLGVSSSKLTTAWDVLMLAVFWADIDLSVDSDGGIYFHEYSRRYGDQSNNDLLVGDRLVFEMAENHVQKAVGDTSFRPSDVIVITWQNVSPYSPHYSTSHEVCAGLTI